MLFTFIAIFLSQKRYNSTKKAIQNKTEVVKFFFQVKFNGKCIIYNTN